VLTDLIYYFVHHDPSIGKLLGSKFTTIYTNEMS